MVVKGHVPFFFFGFALNLCLTEPEAHLYPPTYQIPQATSDQIPLQPATNRTKPSVHDSGCQPLGCFSYTALLRVNYRFREVKKTKKSVPQKGENKDLSCWQRYGGIGENGRRSGSDGGGEAGDEGGGKGVDGGGRGRRC